MDKKKLLLLLMGSFSLTQIKVVGYIGISELIMMLCGPFLFIKNWNNLKRDGFLPCIALSSLWCVSALVTDWYRGTSATDTLKGLASPLSVLLMIPCLYALLAGDIRRIKWAIVGFTVTVFLSTYVIPSGTTYGMAAEQGISVRVAADEYKLTFMSLVVSCLSLIPVLGYFKFPVLSILTTFAMAAFALSQGGRGGFLILLISAAILAFGGGRVERVRKVSAMMPCILVVILCLGIFAKTTYEYVVTRGLMGEQELVKYESQSMSKIGLLSGRNQFVSVFYAVYDSPILGHGSWAIDYEGYEMRAAEWLEDDEEINSILWRSDIELIPGHSHIFTAYVWHGLLGAIFWGYVLWLLWHTLRYNLGLVPECFGYWAITLPSMFWAILFSPFGLRVSTTTAIVMCILLKNIHRSMERSATKRRGCI